MTKKILLTGATGFVGRQVLNSLLLKNFNVRLVVRKAKAKKFDSLKGIESVVITEDLFCETQMWWEKVCAGIDTVIHLAWYTEPEKYFQSPKNFDCLNGTLNLSKGASQAGVRRFVGVGTCAEYDLSKGYIPINTPLKPTTIYSAAKAAAYLILSQYFNVSNIDFAWCRLFYLYGEGEDERRLVPYLRSRLSQGLIAELTNGKQVRDYINVRKAGLQIVEIAEGQFLGAFNICSGIGITVRQLAEQIADEYGRRDLLRFGARPDNILDPPCVVGVISR